MLVLGQQRIVTSDDRAKPKTVPNEPPDNHDHYYPLINKTQIEDLKLKLNVRPKSINNTTPVKQPIMADQAPSSSNHKKRTGVKRNSIKVRRQRSVAKNR